ncbi:MAG: hypothetical protein H6557_34790 [Lewinellaceae bacterium]|nr:hypothetical protein [Lewinellaceae bacterium]
MRWSAIDEAGCPASSDKLSLFGGQAGRLYLGVEVWENGRISGLLNEQTNQKLSAHGRTSNDNFELSFDLGTTKE